MNVELKDAIKTRVFLEEGVKLSGDDPIFAYFTGTQALLDSFSRPVVEAIESIPAVLEQTLEKIVFAVEEAEKTSDTLCAETKSTLTALAKCELESAHQRIKESIESNITSALAESLKSVNADIAEMERKAKALANGFRDPKALLINLVLASTVIVLLCVFSVGSFMLYRAGAKNIDAANFWHEQYQGQQAALNALPASVKKQLPATLKVD